MLLSAAVVCAFLTGVGSAADAVYVQRLLNAKHCRSEFPAERQTLRLAKTDLKVAVQNALGRELRDVRGLEKGTPELVFAMLSHLGGYGEVIWVDNWPSFSVKLKPANTGRPGIEVPRNEAVDAALKAIDDAGGVLIWAGPGRRLIVKKEEREKFEAALRKLGWLRGKETPWDER
jgi:hypothetical protein